MAAAPDVGVVTLGIGLPAPLVDGLAMAAQRPVPELSGELLFAVVKTTTWAAAGEAIGLEEVRPVLGDGFVVSVDCDPAALEGARQDLEHDPELAGAGPAAVLPASSTTLSRRSRRRSSPPPSRCRPSVLPTLPPGARVPASRGHAYR